MKRCLLALNIIIIALTRLAASEELRVGSVHGAALVLTGREEGWRVSRLEVPGGTEGGFTVDDRAVEITTDRGTHPLWADWMLVESGGSRVVLEQSADGAGVRVRRILSFGPASNVLRVETWVQSEEGERVVQRLGLLDWRIEGESFRETGAAPASFPVFGRNLFAGIEHVSGESFAQGDAFQLVQRPRVMVADSWHFVAAAVVGWPIPGAEIGFPTGSAMRIAFLHYLDSVRIKPERIVLHSETWWTMMPPLWEKDVLADIDALQRGFHERTGMFFDTYCLDLGWSDPKTFWQIAEARFPNGFKPINDRLQSLGAKLGLWMSPGSGYPDGLNNAWLQSQGYEMMPFSSLGQAPCFALGTRHQREFKERIVSYAQQYGLGHVILDFMPQYCDVPTHGHPVGAESRYAIDAGVADVLDGLRAVNPQIALEPMVCGYPPSPWWLTKTPFILGPAGDDVPYGRVPCPEWMEALVSARDIAYRLGQEAWLMPTQALETWDIIAQTPGEFENTAVMAIGRGRWFLSSYLKPSLMKPEDWDFFAALVRWARANKESLVNAWMIGGVAEEREAYGYMFRNPNRDLFCVRNPWIEERTIEIPGSALASEPRELRMIYPRRATLARLEPGQGGVRITLGPYETAFLETVPAAEVTQFTPQAEAFAVVTASAPTVTNTDPSEPEADPSRRTYSVFGSIKAPVAESLEFCVLVEAPTDVDRASCDVFINGKAVKLQRWGSAGQFGAAIDASPENWVWFIGALPTGATSTFDVALQVSNPSAKVGVFVRGQLAAESDPEPEGGPVFPVFQSNRRPWSQTVTPVTAIADLIE